MPDDTMAYSRTSATTASVPPKSHHRRHRSVDLGSLQTASSSFSKQPMSPSSPRSVLPPIPEGRASPTSAVSVTISHHPLIGPSNTKPRPGHRKHRRTNSMDGTKSFDMMDQHNVLLQQLKFLREENDFPKLASTQNILGNVYFRERQFDLAISSYKAAISAAKESSSLEAAKPAAEAYCNLGTVYWNVNSVTDAIRCLLKGLELLSRLRLPTAAVHYQLGLAYSLNRSFTQAHQHLQTCIDLYQNQELEMARAYCALASLYQMQSRDSQALRSFQYARQLREDNGASTASVLEQIANLHLETGNLPQALTTFTTIHKQLQKSTSAATVCRLAQTRSRIEQLSFRLNQLK